MCLLLLLTTSKGRTFQVVVILMGKKCCATDVLNRFTIIFFSNIYSPIIEVVIKETSFANIVESAHIFKHLNKLPTKSPFYEAN